MKSLKEWREATDIAVTTPEQQSEPDARDWEFYHTKIQGRAKQYLGWFVDEVSHKQLNLVRKGFILQEVMDALGMDVAQVVKVISNIKRALAKKQKLQAAASQQPQPVPSPVPQTPAQATPTGQPMPNA
jgi:hypothetical protein